jgi:predicted acyltransferase
MNNHPVADSPSRPPRIESIDIFRGLTMLLMLFVNDIGDCDLGFIQNAPWWMKHMAGEIDGMTIADVIFPCFLFIVGLAIPTALERRVARGDSWLRLGGHIATRAASLIFIGLCMVNACHMNPNPMDQAAMGMSDAMWRVLLFSGVLLVWMRYPNASGASKWLFAAMRLAGAVLVIYLVAIYRIDQNGEVIWMRTRWWGIIGLIGWAYLVAAFAWLVCRNHGAALMGSMALLLALNISARSGALSWWPDITGGFLPDLITLGGLSSMVMAGTVIATLFHPDSAAKTPGNRIGWLLLFAAGFTAAGLLLKPLWGIHKCSDSPSWVLCSMGIACAAYAFLYWLVDVKKTAGWLAPVRLAGSNTLLMYILPHIFYSLLAVLGVTYLQTHFIEGWPGVARSAALALGLVGVTALLTKCRVRLQL